MPTQMTLGQLARACGLGRETIRYYERRGLVQRPPRSPAGYRQYDGSAARRVRFIRQAQSVGFSLEEIADLLAMRVVRENQCAEVKARFQRKVADIDARIATLQRMRRAVLDLAASCVGAGPIPDCPILRALDPAGDAP